MFCGNGNCGLWIILILIVLFAFGGCGSSCGCNSDCGCNSGCNSGCGSCC